ncbi:hypothetical protein BDQ17DRAFT_1348889 [Cyathus striatus]|nr:hypothetical protein BDQ17DRAFT_1348889 [Cyathus striatus]
MAELLGPENDNLDPSSSTPPRPLCSVCNKKYAIYTCPRCHIRTCSLPCSSTHKASMGCSGERNKAAYVPMNQYGWGTMVNDYTFLEDVSRKVGDWGREIVKGGYGTGKDSKTRGKFHERGRGGRGGGSNTRTKRDTLKMQLEVRDIDMELLPVGMHRRKVNQSAWDFKNQTALLTVEYIFHPPPDPLAIDTPSPPFTLLTHKNSMKTPLLNLIQVQISERVKNVKKESTIPQWVQSLVLPHSDDPEGFVCPHFVMSAPLDPLLKLTSRSKTKKAYYKFEPESPLDTLLRNTHFVEFPTIEIWEEFNGMLVNKKGLVTDDGEEQQVKRRKLNTKAGKQAINGLLAGYGTDDDGNDEEQTGISLLGTYAESEDENDANVDIPNRNMDTEVTLELEDSDGDGDDAEVDPALLLELLRQARGGETLGIEDEAVDWEDSYEGEED